MEPIVDTLRVLDIVGQYYSKAFTHNQCTGFFSHGANYIEQPKLLAFLPVGSLDIDLVNPKCTPKYESGG